ncbi:MAG: DUF3667 domain-containing protein [Chthoniobacterales bacterium]|nr:DUF3667 domain-containing protein [Chthoniobacterales bacterium]
MSDETPLILGDAVVAELDRPGRRRWFRRKKTTRPPLIHCENCGSQLVGLYCAQCGQPAIDYRRSLGSLMTDAADAFFNFDARFLQSFGLLLIKPWRLTNEFIEGKRARHVHPLRVYLIASVIFFLVINFLSRNGHLQAGRERRGLKVSAAPLPPNTVPSKHDFFTFNFSASPTPSPAGSLGIFPPPEPSVAPSPKEEDIFQHNGNAKDMPPFAKWIEARAREKIGPSGDRAGLFLKALIQNIAPMVLCCIPLFALVLKILYIFKRRFYIDHLIFALHTHAFVFLSTVVIIGLGFLLAMKSEALTAVACTFLGFAVIGQLLIAIRRVYGQNWFATLFKFALGSMIYLVMLSIAFGITAFVTLLLP